MKGYFVGLLSTSCMVCVSVVIHVIINNRNDALH